MYVRQEDDIREKLVVPLAGYRLGKVIDGTETDAFLWSSSVATDSDTLNASWTLHYTSDDIVKKDAQYRVGGYSVRCIKRENLGENKSD